MAPLSILVLVLTWQDSPSKEPVVLGLVGVVKSLAADAASLELAQRGGAITVQTGGLSGLYRVDGTSLAKLKNGARVHVLGARQQSDYYLDPAIHKVELVVRGEFRPPPVPHDLEEQGLQWISGTLHRETEGLMLDGVKLRVRKNIRALEIKKIKREAIPKQATIYVRGTLSGSKADATLAANQLMVLSNRVPAKHYRLIVELGSLTK